MTAATSLYDALVAAGNAPAAAHDITEAVRAEIAQPIAKLVTQDQLKATEATLRADIASVRTEVATLRADTRDLLVGHMRWIIGSWFAGLALAVAAIKLLPGVGP